VLAAARMVVWRELLVAMRRRSDVATALLFFVIVASLFPLGIGAEPNKLRAIAPGRDLGGRRCSPRCLSLGRLFAADHARRHARADGARPPRRSSPSPRRPRPLPMAGVGLPLVRSRRSSRCNTTSDAGSTACLPLSLLLGHAGAQPDQAARRRAHSGVRGGACCLALLVLPLYVPVLVMGAAAVREPPAGLGGQGQLLILGAMLDRRCLRSRPGRPPAALRISSE
jgi:heme exporter protein B